MSPPPSAARSGTVLVGERPVHRMGLGTNRLTEGDEATSVLRRAIELGVDFIDTADVYQSSASERAIGSTLGDRHPEVVVATKGGMLRTPSGFGQNGQPEYLRAALRASLDRLRVPSIELYQLHRVDPTVPIETSVAALREMRESGLIRRIGLSNVTIEELERARRVTAIATVQNRYNVLERQSDGVVDYCERHGIVFIPWTPLLRGNVGGTSTVVDTAARYGVTPHQVALNWLLRRSPAILPIPGTLSIAHLEQNLASAEIDLNETDFRRLSEIPAGAAGGAPSRSSPRP